MTLIERIFADLFSLSAMIRYDQRHPRSINNKHAAPESSSYRVSAEA